MHLVGISSVSFKAFALFVTGISKDILNYALFYRQRRNLNHDRNKL